MKIKTAELIGAALDYAVAKCEGFSIEFEEDDGGRFWINRTNHAQQYYPPFGYLHDVFFPSSDWSQGGEIIEGEKLLICPDQDGLWSAWQHGAHEPRYASGPTPLVAAMRSYCCSKLGNEVEIPEELLK